VWRHLEPVSRFVREYTSGLKTHDLQRLFDREAPAAFQVLTRDQAQPPAAASGAKLAWYRTKVVFLGLSYKLKPARRALFAAAMVCVALGIVRHDFMVEGVGFGVDDSLVWFLLGSAGLLFLLVLELVDRVHVRDELEIARQLQRDLLPHEAPDLDGYHFAFSYRTANEIGGDYYDFIELDDGRLALIAGDASGHGMAAGLLMAIANATLKLALDVDPTPENVANMLNRVLVRTGGSRAFMTLFVGILEPATGGLDFVCAGHPFPLLRRASDQIEEIGSGCLPLGIRPEVGLKPGRVELGHGDILAVYSDGVPEAVKVSTGADFGFERLRRLVELGGTPQQIHDRILHDLELFLDGEPRTDDVSLVVIGRD
jgi:hypothetical protein